MYAKEGSEPEIAQAVANLRGLAARLVIPGDEIPAPLPAGTCRSGETLSTEPSSATQTNPTGERPVVSRLAANPKFQRAIQKFVTKLEEQVATMEQAYKCGDLEELALLAHWLKGAGGTVGFDEFTEPAAELEKFAKSQQVEQTGHVLERVKWLAKAVEEPIIEHSDEAGKELEGPAA